MTAESDSAHIKFGTLDGTEWDVGISFPASFSWLSLK
jgi:hypothetical protein